VPVLLFEFLGVAVGLAVNGALIQAGSIAAEGKRPSLSNCFAVALDRYWPLAGVTLRQAGAALLLAITVVGVPFAIRLLVRWWFGPEAVVLANKDSKGAISLSCQLVEGRWWSLAGLVLIAVLLMNLAFIPVRVLFDVPELAWTLVFSVWVVTVTPVMTVFWALLFLDLTDGTATVSRENVLS
jgi:hypothetical protein